MNQGCGNAGIHSTGDGAQGAAFAHGLANLLNRRIDKFLRRPRGLRVADAEYEILQQVGAEFGVMHFRMELHRVVAGRNVFNGGHGARSTRDEPEAGGEFVRLVAVRHPDRERLRQSAEEGGAFQNRDLGVAVLALAGGVNRASERVRHELQSVADSEHGQSEVEHFGISRRRVDVINRAGTAGENDADRIVAANLLQFGRTRQDNGEDVLLANTPRDELRVLRAEIQDNDGGKRCVFHTQGSQNWGLAVKRLARGSSRNGPEAPRATETRPVRGPQPRRRLRGGREEKYRR